MTDGNCFVQKLQFYIIKSIVEKKIAFKNKNRTVEIEKK